MKTALAAGAVTVLEWLAEFSLQAEHSIRDIAGARRHSPMLESSDSAQ